MRLVGGINRFGVLLDLGVLLAHRLVRAAAEVLRGDVRLIKLLLGDISTVVVLV